MHELFFFERLNPCFCSLILKILPSNACLKDVMQKMNLTSKMNFEFQLRVPVDSRRQERITLPEEQLQPVLLQGRLPNLLHPSIYKYRADGVDVPQEMEIN